MRQLNAPAATRIAAGRQSLLGAGLVTICCAAYLVWVAWPAARETTNGFAAYYTAAYVLAHEPAAIARVYDESWFALQVEAAGIPGVYDIFNIQPPLMSLLLLPLVWLPPDAARLVWTGFSLLLLPAGLFLMARALALPARWALWALPFCLLYAPVSENLRNGQAYLFLFFLLCLLFWATLRGRERVGGAALGIMLIKSAGIWLWPLLLWERRRWALLWGVLVASALALASLPWIGPGAWTAYASHLPRLAAMPERYVTAYQTVTSLFGHLFVYDPRWSPAPALDSPFLAQALTLGLLAGSLALSAYRARRLPAASVRESPLNDPAPVAQNTGSVAGRPRSVQKQALTLALFCSLLAPNVPVAEGYHYLLVLPSLLVAAWYAWHSRAGRSTWAVLLAAALLMGAPLPYKSPQLQQGWLALFAYPRVYGAYLLWAWLGWR